MRVLFRKRLLGAITLVILGVLGSIAPAWGTKSFNVYFVAVGSSDYAAAPDMESSGLRKIVGANRSAREVATRFLSGGARFGVLLTSSPQALVTLKDIHAAIDLVDKRMKSDGAEDGLLLFYFAGHGISEGVGWTQFMVPGDFLYSGSISELPVEPLSKATLTASLLADRLDKAGSRYLMLIDACYEGSEANFDTPILTGTAIDNLKQIADVLRAMNQFRQSSPVLFSTEPGTIVSTVKAPVNPGLTPVAPLARRIMILLDRVAQDGAGLTLSAFVEEMRSETLDKDTQPALTFAESGSDWGYTLVSDREPAGSVKEIGGSASSGAVCCDPSDPEEGNRQDGAVDAVGKIELAGVAGEYITDGMRVSHTGTMSVTQDRPGAMTTTFEKDGDSWELSLAVPEGKPFSPGEYQKAVRYPFAESDQPAIAVLGPGRACNEVRGSFVVESARYRDETHLSALKARFEQYCDESKIPLRGVVDLEIR